MTQTIMVNKDRCKWTPEVTGANLQTFYKN